MAIDSKETRSQRTMDDRFEAARRSLLSTQKSRSLAKASHQNEIQKLQNERQRIRNSIADFVSGLVQRKKQQANDMTVYRGAISEAFGDAFIPAFCLAKQAFLLRAMHSSKFLCFSRHRAFRPFSYVNYVQ